MWIYIAHSRYGTVQFCASYIQFASLIGGFYLQVFFYLYVFFYYYSFINLLYSAWTKVKVWTLVIMQLT